MTARRPLKFRVYRVTIGSWSKEIDAPNIRWAIYQASRRLPKRLPDTRRLDMQVEYLRDSEIG